MGEDETNKILKFSAFPHKAHDILAYLLKENS